MSIGNITVGSLTASNITVANNITSGSMSIGNITVGSLTASNITVANNITSGSMSIGNITVGSLISTSINLSTNSFTSGNVYVGNIIAYSISPAQYVETIVPLTYAANVTAGFLSSTLFSIASVTGAITGLAITGIPLTSYRSYTMSFILATTSSSGYISAGSITVNGTAVNLKGTINASTPTTYVVQQVSIFNINGTFTAVTSASFF